MIMYERVVVADGGGGAPIASRPLAVQLMM